MRDVRYSSNSRLLKRQTKQLYKRITIFLILSLILIFGVVSLGIPILVKVSLVLDSFKGASEPVATNDTQIVQPPTLSIPYEATNSAQISIDGNSDAGNTVEVFVNDKKIAKVLAASDGGFEVSDVELQEGDNKITAIATSVNGKKSEESSPFNVLYKKTEPSLTIDSPSDGASFSGENKEINITGKTDPDAKVYVNDRMIIVSGDGKFNYSYTLSEGTNNFKVTAIDTAGNKKEINLKVNYSS